MQGKTIVYDAITVKREGGFAFDVWHQNHYVPSVLATGQMLNVQCYGSPLRATYVAVFESNADAGALQGALPAPAHESIISSERHVATFMNQQIAPGTGDPFHEAPILYPVLFSIPSECEKDFNAWYDDEHVLALAAVPGVLCARRFRTGAAVTKYVALYHLTGPGVVDSAEWKHASASTPMPAHVRETITNRHRLVCRAYTRA